ncbi:TetR/AcrR family transcriptional regulator [Nocardia asteroides]|uniref:TetR/AcrR family transcriptional regulator n=1 Tax=Nocardia asteroides TaxID=1824 RepID=UPI0037CAF85C
MARAQQNPPSGPFQRARRPEHKDHRRREILAAAATLAAERGVGKVSLADIGKVVGLTKSNVLRYFETREAIYLHLSADAYRGWAERIGHAVHDLPVGPTQPETIARLLTDTIAADPLMCDLLGTINTVLEHNVSLEAALVHKRAARAALDTISTSLARAHAGLSARAARELALATAMIAASAWPATHPSTVLTEAYRADSDLAEFIIEFDSYLTRAIMVYLRGLLAE